MWAVIYVAQRTNDFAFQEIQKTHAASVSLILKAASEITNLLSKSTSTKDQGTNSHFALRKLQSKFDYLRSDFERINKFAKQIFLNFKQTFLL